jgi:hypothetical protein
MTTPNTKEKQDSIIAMSLIECQICYKTLTSNKQQPILTCGCQFCHKCLRSYIKERVSNGLATVPCPNDICVATLKRNQIQNLVDEGTFERFVTLMNNQAVAQDQSLAWCPIIDCDTLCKIASLNINEITECTKCGNKFNVKELENEWMIKKTEIVKAVDEGPTENNRIRMCPGCEILIQKVHGCDSMRCKQCKTNFNFETGETIPQWELVTSDCILRIGIMTLVVAAIMVLLEIKVLFVEKTFPAISILYTVLHLLCIYVLGVFLVHEWRAINQ